MTDFTIGDCVVEKDTGDIFLVKKIMCRCAYIPSERVTLDYLDLWSPLMGYGMSRYINELDTNKTYKKLVWHDLY